MVRILSSDLINSTDPKDVLDEPKTETDSPTKPEGEIDQKLPTEAISSEKPSEDSKAETKKEASKVETEADKTSQEPVEDSVTVLEVEPREKEQATKETIEEDTAVEVTVEAVSKEGSEETQPKEVRVELMTGGQENVIEPVEETVTDKLGEESANTDDSEKDEHKSEPETDDSDCKQKKSGKSEKAKTETQEDSDDSNVSGVSESSDEIEEEEDSQPNLIEDNDEDLPKLENLKEMDLKDVLKINSMTIDFGELFPGQILEETVIILNNLTSIKVPFKIKINCLSKEFDDLDEYVYSMRRPTTQDVFNYNDTFLILLAQKAISYYKLAIKVPNILEEKDILGNIEISCTECQNGLITIPIKSSISMLYYLYIFCIHMFYICIILIDKNVLCMFIEMIVRDSKSKVWGQMILV